MRQLVTTEKRHERLGERRKPVEKGLQRGLAAERIAEQDRDEVDDVVVAGAATG